MSVTVHRTRTRWFAIVALTLALVAATFGILPPADAAAPESPRDLSVTQPDETTTILSWGEVAGASKYDVAVDDDPGFGSPYATVRTANTTYVPTMALKAGTNHWRVRAVSALGETSGWSAADFGNPEVDVPVPAAPTDGATLQQPGNPPLLSWSGSPGATSYTVEVDGDSDFVGAFSYTTRTTSLVVPDPLGAGDWFWRVTASKGAGMVSEVSVVRSFWIAPINAPVITSPPDDPDHELRDVVLDWDPVPGAKSYDVQVATNTDFSTGSLIETRTGIFGTRYSPTTTYDNNQYFWRVRAVDLAGQATPWTAARYDFNRTWPYVPTPVHPADPTLETVRTPAYFQWTSVKHASEYEIQVGTQENFSVGTFESCRTAGTTYTPGMFAINTNGLPSTFRENEDCEPQAGQTNYWRVRPLDRPFAKQGDIPGIQGIFSPTQAFFYQPASITAMAPTGGATVDVPTLTWAPTVGAESYSIRVLRANGTVADTATTSSTSYTIDGTQPLKSSDNPHRWQITATTAEGQKSVTYTNYFSVSGNLPSSSEPALTPLTPTASTPGIQDAPALTWAPMPGAHHYSVNVGTARDGDQVWFGHEFADLFGQPVPYPAMTDTSKRLMLPGTYDWQVTAYAADNTVMGVGPEGRFTVQPLAPTTGHALAIDGQELDGGGTDTPCTTASGDCTVPTTPVLRWKPDPRASFYMVYVSEDASFTNLLEPSNAIPATTNILYAPALDNRDHTYADNQAGQAYHWFIRPCRTVLNCGPDPVSTTNKAQHSFVKRSPGVTGLTSTDPSASEITFSWDDYWDTNRASSWQQTGETRPQAAKQYRIQVDDDESFAGTLVDERLVDQPTYTAFDRLYPEGTYFWRVQAVDSDDNGLTWSDRDTTTPFTEPHTFTKKSLQVQLSTPVGNASVAGTAPFRWKSQAFASSYDIEVYKNNDTTYSLANRVFTKTVKTSAYAYDAPLAASKASYLWRVRRTDADGNKGPWSAPGRFMVDEAVVKTTAPADGGSQPPNGPVLSWTPLAGATSYAVEVRPTTGSGGVVTGSTVAAAYATTTEFQTGTYRWTVTAKDAAGNVVGAGEATFSVDARLVAVEDARVNAPSGTGVGQTLTTTPPSWNQSGVTNTYQWLRDGNTIWGSTGETYQVTSSDYGKRISVKVVGKKAGYADGVSYSNDIVTTAGDALVATQRPTITGTAEVNSSLRVEPGTWSSTPTSLSYQWLRDGSVVANATGQTYWLRAEDAGSAISARVTAKKTGFADGTATTNVVTVAKVASTTSASLSTKRAKPRTRVKMYVTVSASGVVGPTGKIKVKKGKRTITKVALRADQYGRRTVRLPRLRRGKYRLRAVYTGSSQVRGSRSTRMRLVIRR